VLALAARIRSELGDLQRALVRAQEGWQRAQFTSDDLYVDSVALNLHALYRGLEGLFEQIASVVDGAVPQGADWHKQLLDQLANEVPGVRPSVLSPSSRALLDRYRGFRSIVNNVCAFRFDPSRVGDLVDGAPSMLALVGAELIGFASFLESRTGGQV
jgi:hypothetical protein